MAANLYQSDNGSNAIRPFTISILTEDKSGLLNRVTIVFTRRKINIDSLNVSVTEVPGVSRYTLVVQATRDQAVKVVKQIERMVEVLGAFLYEEDEVHYQEIALYKVPTKAFLGGNKIEKMVRDNAARILVIEEEYIIIEKTGYKEETQKLFNLLEPHGVLEFVRSGRVAISKSKRKTTTFLKQLEESTTNMINI